MSRKNKHILRSIASLLLIALFAQELGHAAPVGGEGSLQTNLLQNPFSFSAPSEFCSVSEIHQGRSNALIIHIQDAHSNFSGQENLAKTLDQISRRYDISQILVEGGEGDVSLTPLRQAADKKICAQRAKSLLMQGQIQGEEFLNLTSERPLNLMGAEDLSLYAQSLVSYAELASQRESASAYLSKIRLALEKIKNKIYPVEIRSYETLKKKGSFEAELSALIDLSADKRDLPSSFSQFLRLKELENSPDKEKAQQMLAQLDLAQLLQDKEQYEKRVLISRLESEDARLIWAIDRYTALLDLAYQIKLTSEDFDDLLANEPDFLTPAYLSFLNKKLAQLGYFEDLLAYEKTLDQTRKVLGDFYGSVAKRDHVFLSKADEFIRNGHPAVVLIAGGYHTRHLTELMRQKNYSYIVLTPKVTAATNVSKYEKVLMEPLNQPSTWAQEQNGWIRVAAAGSRLSPNAIVETKASAKARLEVYFALKRQRLRAAVQDVQQKLPKPYLRSPIPGRLGSQIYRMEGVDFSDERWMGGLLHWRLRPLAKLMEREITRYDLAVDAEQREKALKKLGRYAERMGWVVTGQRYWDKTDVIKIFSKGQIFKDYDLNAASEAIKNAAYLMRRGIKNSEGMNFRDVIIREIKKIRKCQAILLEIAIEGLNTPRQEQEDIDRYLNELAARGEEASAARLADVKKFQDFAEKIYAPKQLNDGARLTASQSVDALSQVQRYSWVLETNIVAKIDAALKTRGAGGKFRLLELGCSPTPLFLQELKKKYKDAIEVVGIDIEVKDKSVGTEIDDYITGDINHELIHLYTAGEKFDGVVSLGAFGSVDDPTEALRWSYEILNPSGFLVVHTPALSQRELKLLSGEGIELNIRNPLKAIYTIDKKKGQAGIVAAARLAAGSVKPWETASLKKLGAADIKAFFKTRHFEPKSLMYPAVGKDALSIRFALDAMPSLNRLTLIDSQYTSLEAIGGRGYVADWLLYESGLFSDVRFLYSDRYATAYGCLYQGRPFEIIFSGEDYFNHKQKPVDVVLVKQPGQGGNMAGKNAFWERVKADLNPEGFALIERGLKRFAATREVLGENIQEINSAWIVAASSVQASQEALVAAARLTAFDLKPSDIQELPEIVALSAELKKIFVYSPELLRKTFDQWRPLLMRYFELYANDPKTRQVYFLTREENRRAVGEMISALKTGSKTTVMGAVQRILQNNTLIEILDEATTAYQDEIKLKSLASLPATMSAKRLVVAGDIPAGREQLFWDAFYMLWMLTGQATLKAGGESEETLLLAQVVNDYGLIAAEPFLEKLRAAGKAAVERNVKEQTYDVHLVIETLKDKLFPGVTGEELDRMVLLLGSLYWKVGTEEVMRASQSEYWFLSASFKRGFFDVNGLDFNVTPIERGLMPRYFAQTYHHIFQELAKRNLSGGMAVYPYSGADVSSAFYATDADVLEMSDWLDFGLEMEETQLKDAPRLKWRYFVEKGRYGYSSSQMLRAVGYLKFPILWEIEAMGGTDVEISKSAEPDTWEIRFNWSLKANGQDKRLRKIIFRKKRFESESQSQAFLEEAVARGGRHLIRKAMLLWEPPMIKAFRTYLDIGSKNALEGEPGEIIPLTRLTPLLKDPEILDLQKNSPYGTPLAGSLAIRSGARLAETVFSESEITQIKQTASQLLVGSVDAPGLRDIKRNILYFQEALADTKNYLRVVALFEGVRDELTFHARWMDQLGRNEKNAVLIESLANGSRSGGNVFDPRLRTYDLKQAFGKFAGLDPYSIFDSEIQADLRDSIREILKIIDLVEKIPTAEIIPGFQTQHKPGKNRFVDFARLLPAAAAGSRLAKSEEMITIPEDRKAGLGKLLDYGLFFLGQFPFYVEELGGENPAKRVLAYYPRKFRRDDFGHLDSWAKRAAAMSYIVYGEVLPDNELAQRLEQGRAVDEYMLRRAGSAFLAIQDLGSRKNKFQFKELLKKYREIEKKIEDKGPVHEVIPTEKGYDWGRSGKIPVEKSGEMDIDLLRRAVDIAIGNIPTSGARLIQSSSSESGLFSEAETVKMKRWAAMVLSGSADRPGIRAVAQQLAAWKTGQTQELKELRSKLKDINTAVLKLASGAGTQTFGQSISNGDPAARNLLTTDRLSSFDLKNKIGALIGVIDLMLLSPAAEAENADLFTRAIADLQPIAAGLEQLKDVERAPFFIGPDGKQYIDFKALSPSAARLTESFVQEAGVSGKMTTALVSQDSSIKPEIRALVAQIAAARQKAVEGARLVFPVTASEYADLRFGAYSSEGITVDLMDPVSDSDVQAIQVLNLSPEVIKEAGTRLNALKTTQVKLPDNFGQSNEAMIAVDEVKMADQYSSMALWRSRPLTGLQNIVLTVSVAGQEKTSFAAEIKELLQEINTRYDKNLNLIIRLIDGRGQPVAEFEGFRSMEIPAGFENARHYLVGVLDQALIDAAVKNGGGYLPIEAALAENGKIKVIPYQSALRTAILGAIVGQDDTEFRNCLQYLTQLEGVVGADQVKLVQAPDSNTTVKLYQDAKLWVKRLRILEKELYRTYLGARMAGAAA